MARLRNETGYVLNVEVLGRMVGPGEEFDGPVDNDGKPVHVPGCPPVEAAGEPPADPPQGKPAEAKAGKAGKDTP